MYREQDMGNPNLKSIFGNGDRALVDKEPRGKRTQRGNRVVPTQNNGNIYATFVPSIVLSLVIMFAFIVRIVSRLGSFPVELSKQRE